MSRLAPTAPSGLPDAAPPRITASVGTVRRYRTTTRSPRGGAPKLRRGHPDEGARHGHRAERDEGQREEAAGPRLGRHDDLLAEQLDDVPQRLGQRRTLAPLDERGHLAIDPAHGQADEDGEQHPGEHQEEEDPLGDLAHVGLRWQWIRLAGRVRSGEAHPHVLERAQVLARPLVVRVDVERLAEARRSRRPGCPCGSSPPPSGSSRRTSAGSARGPSRTPAGSRRGRPSAPPRRRGGTRPP